MTTEEIRQKINTEEYNFLRTDPHLTHNRLILLGLGGSYAYGTNVETSDLDIRGVTLNSKEEILTNQNFEQFIDNTTDTVIYSFNKIISLLTNANPNVIEILGLKPEHYLYISPIGQELLNNKKLFISKKCIQTFGGYANQQLYRLRQLEKHQMEQSKLEEHILKTLQFMKTDFNTTYSQIKDDSLNLYIDKSDREEMETEIYMDVKLTHYPLRDYLSMWNSLQNVTSQYNKIGKRNKNAMEHDKIAKHMMHLVRLYLMCFDLLDNAEINTYREKEHDFLMEIRNGKYITEDNEVLPEFYDLVDEYEKKLARLKDTTRIPNKPDYDKINKFMMDVNERVIKNKIQL